MITTSALHEILRAGFPDAEIELVDLTGTQDHYAARIASAAFVGKSVVEQHQLVYRALGDLLAGPLHALSLRTQLPTPPSSRTEDFP